MKTNTVDKAAKRISETNKLIYCPEIEAVLQAADQKLEAERAQKRAKELKSFIYRYNKKLKEKILKQANEKTEFSR